MNNIREFAGKDIKVSLIGNKNDLEREVNENECESLANSLNIKYFDCSAKENKGFRECVLSLCSEISNNKKKDEELSLDTKKIDENKCGC